MKLKDIFVRLIAEYEFLMYICMHEYVYVCMYLGRSWGRENMSMCKNKRQPQRGDSVTHTHTQLSPRYTHICTHNEIYTYIYMYVDICIYDYRVLEVQSKVKPALKSFL